MSKKLLVLSLLINFLFLIGFLLFIHKLGGISYTLYKLKNRGIAGVYEHRKNMYEQLPINENAIVFLGNSITEYGPWTELFPSKYIVNRGIAGDFTDGVLKRLEGITDAHPAKIFLMIGINDLIMYSPDHILNNYRTIISRIRKESAETRLIIQSTLPVNNEVKNTGLNNGDVIEINEGLITLSKEFAVEYIDLFPFLVDENGYLKAEFTADGIHLNGDAYLVWKKVIFNRVME